MNKSAKKLVLNKTTIRALQPEELRTVVGGVGYMSLAVATLGVPPGSQDYCAGPYHLEPPPPLTAGPYPCHENKV